MYDIIGDIHGHLSKLEQLLGKLNYQKINGTWHHPERKAIFVGDYIDRGPQIRETLQLVKGMTDAGAAIALMGNHEYNAVAFATPDGSGDFLRSHNAVHTKQHSATLEQFAGHEDEWQDYLQWFYTLPLFLELGGIRAVHACWDQENIEWLKSNGHATLDKELLFASHIRNSRAYDVINETLKGKEFNIPEEFTWHDKDGHARNANRIKWWVDPKVAVYDDFLFNCPVKLHHEQIPADLEVNIYPADAPPVFFGHYWLEDKFPVIQRANVVCLDYSVAKGGSLVAYRWTGEKEVDGGNFVVVS